MKDMGYQTVNSYQLFGITRLVEESFLFPIWTIQVYLCINKKLVLNKTIFFPYLPLKYNSNAPVEINIPSNMFEPKNTTKHAYILLDVHQAHQLGCCLPIYSKKFTPDPMAIIINIFATLLKDKSFQIKITYIILQLN